MNEITQPANAAKTWKTKMEIADHFQCHIRTVTKLMKRRILPFVKIGRLVRFDLAECDRVMERYRSKTIFD
jgi:excisionase family DNA binding protein